MEEQRAVPEPWAAAYKAVGAVDARPGGREAQPTFQGLARLTGVHATTLASLAYGTFKRGPKQATIEKVAAALKLDVRVVEGWIGRVREVEEPYIAPVEANLLDRRQRKAVDEIILSIVQPMIAAQQAEQGKVVPLRGRNQGSGIARPRAARRDGKSDGRRIRQEDRELGEGSQETPGSDD